MGTPIQYSADSREIRTNNDELVFQKPKVETLTADRTLSADDDGSLFITGAVDLVITLPATVEGLTFSVFTETLSVTTGVSISPAAADAIFGGGLTSVDNKDLINTALTDAVGDMVTLVGDGVKGWYITQDLGVWAKEA